MEEYYPGTVRPFPTMSAIVAKYVAVAPGDKVTTAWRTEGPFRGIGTWKFEFQTDYMPGSTFKPL